jgi:glycosyltransferase involved in cell wall biosynthesis
MKNVSIIIPTKDKLSRLGLVLKALEPQIDETVEVLVIFDGCAEETLRGFDRIKLGFRPVKIIHEQNQGRAKARNSGIRRAEGEIVIFLDDDRIPAPGFVRKHVQAHENGRYAVVGERGDVAYSDEKLEQWFVTGLSGADFKQMAADAVKEPYDWMKKLCRGIFGQVLESVTFSTGNSSVRRRDLMKIGLFDEAFTGWGVEDVDLGYRLAKDGVIIRRDYSIINYHLVHPVSRSQQKIEYWRNFDYFMSKIRQDKIAKMMYSVLSFMFFR